MTQKPSLGRIVHVVGGPAEANGTDVAPAIVTRVWSDTMVNVTVHPDAPTTGRATSVTLFETEEAARLSGLTVAAFWPPRV